MVGDWKINEWRNASFRNGNTLIGGCMNGYISHKQASLAHRGTNKKTMTVVRNMLRVTMMMRYMKTSGNLAATHTIKMANTGVFFGCECLRVVSCVVVSVSFLLIFWYSKICYYG